MKCFENTGHRRSLLLCALLAKAILLSHVCARKLGTVEINGQKNIIDHEQIFDGHNHNHVHNPSNGVAKEHSIYFHLDDLNLGQKIPLFVLKKPSSRSYFLTRDRANSVPFSLEKLDQILEFFSFAPGSKQAIAVEYTLKTCESSPIRGETKLCATSFESMLDFAGRVFGPTRPELMASAFRTDLEEVGFQNYTIVENPREIFSGKTVACHSLSYPHIVFLCHKQAAGFRLFKVLFGGENGEVFDAVAGCHLDTSEWDPQHPAFRVLGNKPGLDQPVCHIFPPHGNFLWVDKTPGVVTASSI